jgi:cytochrome b involved in lipid metabolism
MLYTYRFNGPADQGILLKNRGNNARLDSKMAMPQKFYPSAGDSMFSSARKTYISEYGDGENVLNKYSDSSQYTHVKKFNAVGKSSQLNISTENPLSFRSQDTTSRNSAVRRCRSSGCVAPKKKGALENTYKSGGSSFLTGTGNRQYIVPVRDTTVYYTSAQVLQHNTLGNVWISYDGLVYNITSYISELNSLHEVPANTSNVFQPLYWGKDLTNIINNAHSTNKYQVTLKMNVLSMLAPYQIGVIRNTVVV